MITTKTIAAGLIAGLASFPCFADEGRLLGLGFDGDFSAKIDRERTVGGKAELTWSSARTDRANFSDVRLKGSLNGARARGGDRMTYGVFEARLNVHPFGETAPLASAVFAEATGYISKDGAERSVALGFSGPIVGGVSHESIARYVGGGQIVGSSELTAVWPVAAQMSLEPRLGLEATLRDPNTGADLNKAYAGASLVYAATPALSPYVDLEGFSLLGQDRRDAKTAMTHTEGFVAKIGLRVKF